MAITFSEPTSSISTVVCIPYYGSSFEYIRYHIPDIPKLRRVTGFEPAVGLDEILSRVVAITRERLKMRAPA
jgi:hypothetical protein